MDKTKIIPSGLFAILLLGLTSCVENPPTQEEIVQTNAEEYVKSKMNDPESFEFVGLKLIDSVLISDNIAHRKEMFSGRIKFELESIERKERSKSDFIREFGNIDYVKKLEMEIEDRKAEIEKNERILTKIDSIATQLGERKDEVASYTYIFSFRGTNSFGAKVLNEYILQTDPAPEFKVLNMTNDKGKVILNPNEFPGYIEMMEKNL